MKLPKRAYWAVVTDTGRPLLKTNRAMARRWVKVFGGTIHRVRLVAVGAGEKK